MALKLAGIDRNTPDPPGGKIERDAFGEPTGVLKENARNLLAPYLPAEPRENRWKIFWSWENFSPPRGYRCL